jgi:hypothetical protein
MRGIKSDGFQILNEASRRDILRIAQRFSVGSETACGQVPERRLKRLSKPLISTVPSGLGSRGLGFPTLKRWAILVRPFGTSCFRQVEFLIDIGTQQP